VDVQTADFNGDGKRISPAGIRRPAIGGHLSGAWADHSLWTTCPPPHLVDVKSRRLTGDGKTTSWPNLSSASGGWRFHRVIVPNSKWARGARRSRGSMSKRRLQRDGKMDITGRCCKAAPGGQPEHRQLLHHKPMGELDTGVTWVDVKSATSPATQGDIAARALQYGHVVGLSNGSTPSTPASGHLEHERHLGGRQSRRL